MADKFHVGQRVMVKYSIQSPELVGCVVTITQQRKLRINISEGPSFGYGTDCMSQGYEFCPEEDQLEPLPDGWEKTTWDQCMWRPKEVEVKQ